MLLGTAPIRLLVTMPSGSESPVMLGSRAYNGITNTIY